MPIRFTCPSCQQPLEVDDANAGQVVACHYCKRLVNAPSTSTWEPAAQIPVAQPARSGFEPPPPPNSLPRVPQAGGSTARWALALSLGSAAALMVGVLGWYVAITGAVFEKVGSDQPTPEQWIRAQQELAEAGALPTSPWVAAVMIVGLILGIIGLVVGIKAIRTRRGFGMAVTACVVAILAIICEGMVTLSLISMSILRYHQA